RSGRLQAPQGARGRRPRHASPGRPAAPRSSGGGDLRPHDEVDRALPPSGGGAVPKARRRTPHHARRGVQAVTSPIHDQAQGEPTMTTTRETEIVADPKVPLIRITREFDAPVAKLFRAHTDPDLLVQWLGPRDLEMSIDYYDCRRGGSYRYVHRRGDHEFGFHGSIHDVEPARYI